MPLLYREIDTKRRFSNFSHFEYHVIDIRMRRMRVLLTAQSLYTAPTFAILVRF